MKTSGIYLGYMYKTSTSVNEEENEINLLIELVDCMCKAPDVAFKKQTWLKEK